MPYEVKGKCVYKKDGGAKVGCTKGSVKDYLAALHANADESVELEETITESKPKIFTYTAYRLPNSEDIKEINNSKLSAKEIFDGLSYTLIGRGILSNETKHKIVEAINMLIESNPNNDEYKKALDMAKNMTGRFVTEANTIKGGKADKMSVKDIADKFGVTVAQINRELAMGKKVEHEHTTNMSKANEIAMDHLSEFPDYYTRLAKMEKEAEKHAKKLEMNEDTKSLIKRLIRENLGF
jgi:hypothetical protein